MTVTALFTEQVVRVTEGPDPTCLIKIDGQKMNIAGRKTIRRKPVKIHTEEGDWKDVSVECIPVVEVKARE